MQLDAGKRLSENLLRIPARKDGITKKALEDWKVQLQKKFDDELIQAWSYLDARAKQILVTPQLPEEAHIFRDNLNQIVFNHINALASIASQNPAAFKQYCEEVINPIMGAQNPDFERIIGNLSEYDLMSGIDHHFAKLLEDLDEFQISAILSVVILQYIQREGQRHRLPDLYSLEIALARMSLQLAETISRLEELETKVRIT